MDHVSNIHKYIDVVIKSQNIHAVIVQGPPGWGKSTAVRRAIEKSTFTPSCLGSYSSSLNLFNFLYENKNDIVLIDDCAGIFNDSQAMAILKAASWSNSMSPRIVSWGTTSTKAKVQDFEFKGKLIIVCNSLQRSPDIHALKSRAFTYMIEVDIAHSKECILNAAQNMILYPDSIVAKTVANFLIGLIEGRAVSNIDLRTLRFGYELALNDADNWKDLLLQVIPAQKISPLLLVKELSATGLHIKDQLLIYEEKTGLKRRSFFYHRLEAGLTG